MKGTMVTLLIFFLLFVTIVAAEFFLTGTMGKSEEATPISQLIDVGEELSKEILVAEQ
jgi:hypothetical protein